MRAVMQPKFYNSLTRRVEPLEPLVPGTVRMYTCGPTVYNFAHIGNFRAYMFEDLLRRTLEPVRAFQKRHHARIYVGEFSAASYAPGAENYLRDAISLFEEYGWDWTYHAFREADVWNVEKVRNADGKYVPSADNPRKRALLDGFAGCIKPTTEP